MRPDYSNKWIACRPFNTDQLEFAVIQLDGKVKAELKRLSETWDAAAAAYGNHDVNLSVHENFVYWVSELPTIWGGIKITNQWTVLEMDMVAALAFAGDEKRLTELLSSHLLECEVIMSDSRAVARQRAQINFEGQEKYGPEGEAATSELPKEVMDWVLAG